ncbi:hypothetical protein ALQ39_05784 [Pseudomonas amygdali pv. eriobotryae]|uniref:Uncharacterized protein n=1 Tax=Pseudomonas amygdali pv. eriobotryae TaxID=129137 RepID=A0A3M3XBY6_PSEA0|nr:hypothetical protein ALQ39_05784 [Pseudomonas amygdali pv. eriobotryae]
MPEVVVVSLEVVDIDHQQRQLRLIANGTPPLQLEVLIEMAAIGQPRQAIGVHKALQHQVGVKQLLLADPQGTIGFVTLQQCHIGARVVANARHQFDVVRQFDQIIVGPGRERGALDQRVFLGGQHDDRDIAGQRVAAVLANQRQTVEARHDQILKNHGRFDLHGLGNCLMRVGAKVEVDRFVASQPTPDSLANHGLIINQKHHGGVLIRGLDLIRLQVMHSVSPDRRPQVNAPEQSLSKYLDQARGNGGQRTYLNSSINGCSRFGHAIHSRTCLILGDGQKTSLPHCLESLRTIAPHAGQ